MEIENRRLLTTGLYFSHRDVHERESAHGGKLNLPAAAGALVFSDAPICKDGSSTQVVGALKHETISLVCGVQSKPPPTTFHWTFNNSGELMSVPATKYAQVKPLSLITSHWHGSRLNYTPENDMDYGTVACWARNRIGMQKTPCLFQIIVAGKPYPLQNCTALQSTGPYAYRMGKRAGRVPGNPRNDLLTVPLHPAIIVADTLWSMPCCVQQLVSLFPLEKHDNRENAREISFYRSSMFSNRLSSHNSIR